MAQQVLDRLPSVVALEVLAANAQLVELLVGRRWYVMQAAREVGASWGDIGAALGLSAEAEPVNLLGACSSGIR